MTAEDIVQIAVRPLVEYVFLSGDLDSGGFRTASSLVEGTKAHQMIQKEYGEQDQKEVYLSAEIPCGDMMFLIDGRCDGLLIAADGTVTIDEIKSTAGDIHQITEDSSPVHWAQAKCYAYMYAKLHSLSEIHVQLTYVQIHTGEQMRFRRTEQLDELEVWISDIVGRYAPFARLIREHRTRRDRSIQELSFPFPDYRPGQRKLAGAVYKSIEEGVNLFAKAPTGIGKTISTTFPAIKAIGQGLIGRMFYLTAKTITRTAAEDAFRLMQSGGLQLHTVTITAKDKICFQEEVSCRPEICPFAEGYFDRINGAVLDILQNETRMNRAMIEQYAKKHRVCPFEFSLDLAYAADVVICDYNYIFDPRVSLKRLTGEQRKQTAILIDESHNLVDRAREMFSAALDKAPFLQLQREYKSLRPGIYQAAKALNAHFIALRKQAEEAAGGTRAAAGGSRRPYQKPLIRKEAPEELLALAEQFAAEAEAELASSARAGSAEQQELLLDAYFAANQFIKIGKLFDERYVTYAEVSRQEVRVKLLCLDPSHLLRETGKGYRSRIHFSATLSPMSFYRDLLGADEEDYTVSVPSPFRKEQLQVEIHPLSTRYHDRERTSGALSELLTQLTRERAGNYLFFFPSYAYMNLVYEQFAANQPEGVDTLLQRGDLTEEEREDFLSQFTGDREGTLAGFAVMGGIFSEGIDLVGDRLTGVVVVGVGLPQINSERDIIRDYYSAAGKNGYDYAYVYPGMNKVWQAGGRLIRSEEDHGVLVLVDDRYLEPHYARLLPEEWR